MKPWRTDPDSPSDFARNDAAIAQHYEPLSPASTAARSLTGVGATTLALGFAEACVLVERRPIPLPFATKFALYNVLPSAVWSTVGPQHVATVSKLPLNRLVTSATVQGGPNLPNFASSHAKRCIAIKTLRSLRYGVASYGILWSAWRWHEEVSRLRGDGDRSAAPEDSAHVPVSAGRAGCVVRLAPTGSSLSKATATKHGDHVRHVPWRAVQRGDVIDWSTVGLEEARSVTTTTACAVASAEPLDSEARAPLKVLELEIDGSHHEANAFLVAQRAAAGANGFVHTVAVVDAAASPEWHDQSNGVGVYYFALSGIVRFLCEHLDAEPTDREIVLVTAVETDDDTALEQEKALLLMVRRALIHRHGIATSVGIKHALHDDDEDGNDDEDDTEQRATVPPALTALFSPTADDAAKQLARVAGLVSVDRTLVVIDESLCSLPTIPPVLAKCAGVLSVADLTDTVLQHIREQLRAGVTPDTIQLSIYEAFGEQSVLLRRADEASDITKYI